MQTSRFITHALVYIVLLTPLVTKAQDIHFSQFFAAPLTLNPANTGVFNGKYRFATNYKSQWGSITNPYKTTFASFDMPLKRNAGGNGILSGGLSFFSDKGGSSNLGLTQVDVSVAYNLKVNDYNAVSVGIQGGFAQRSIALADLRWDNQYGGNGFDATIGSGETNLSGGKATYGDVSGGALWRYIGSEKFKANGGISMSHINKPNQSLYDTKNDNLNYKFIIHGGAEIIYKASRYSALPNFMIAEQGSAYEVTCGALVKSYLGTDATKYKDGASHAIYFGAFYRWQDAVILITRMDLKQNLSFGLSYDINVSNLSTASYGKGGLELSLTYKVLSQKTAF